MRLKALTAVELTTKLRAVGQAIWPSEPVEMEVGTAVQGLKLNAGATTGQELATQPAVNEFMKLLGTRENLFATSGLVRFASDHNRAVRYASSDQVIGTIEIAGAKNAQQAVTWLTVVEKHFDLAPDVEVVATVGMSEPQHKALQLVAQANADFRTEVSRLAQLLAQIAREDAEQRRELNAQLEKDWRDKAEASALEHQQRMQEVEDRRRTDREKLDADRADFEKEKASFETGEAKHLRRKMLAKLEEVLAKSESMKLSEETAAKRNLVHAFAALLLLATAAMAVSMGIKYWDGGDVRYGIPMGTAMVSFVATLVYYLKWNDRWFREHSDAELAAKRYQADIVRANWLAELVAEQKQLSSELPPELLEAFTRNLFRGSTTLAEAEHPFEQITGLLKRAKKLRFGGGQLALEAADRKRPKGDDSE